MKSDHQTCKYRTLRKNIIHIFHKVHKKLGYGYREKVYRDAMMIELKKVGIPVYAQAGIRVFYEGALINETDGYILIDNKVIIKIKTEGCLVKDDETKLLDYLKAANLEVGFLFNFGSKPEVKLTTVC